MRQLYEQVRVDEEQMKFFAQCEISGKKIYSYKVPVICRSKALVEAFRRGSVGGIRQKLYNKSHAASIQDLAKYFNQCRKCGRWVCDEKYDPEKMECTECIEKNI